MRLSSHLSSSTLLTALWGILTFPLKAFSTHGDSEVIPPTPLGSPLQARNLADTQKVRAGSGLRLLAISTTLAIGWWAIFLGLDGRADPPIPTTQPHEQSQDQNQNREKDKDSLHHEIQDGLNNTHKDLLLVGGILATILGIATTALTLKRTAIDPILNVAGKVKGTLATLDRLDKMWSGTNREGGTYADAVFQIREELFIAKAHLHIIQRHLSIPTFELDEFGNLDDANKVFMQLLDATESEIRKSGWVGFIHHLDRNDALNAIKEALQQKRDFQVEARFTKPNGEVTPLYKLRGFRRVLPNEDLQGFVVSVEEK